MTTLQRNEVPSGSGGLLAAFGGQGALVVFVVFVAANMLLTPNFVAVNTISNIGLQVYPVMLVALGMTVVIASGGIDISVGASIAFAGSVTAKLLGSLGIAPAILAGIAAASAFGLFNGFVISIFRIQPVIVTLIMMIAGRGVAQLVNNGYTITFYGTDFANLGLAAPLGVPLQFYVMTAVAALVYLFLHKRLFGLQLQAMGDNFRAARLSGVNTTLVIVAAYLISSWCCAVAAVLETARMCSADASTIGKMIEMDAIAAVAIGGTPMTGGRANVLGTILGALTMQLITISVNMNNIPFSYSLILKSGIIVCALYLHRGRGK